METKKSSQQEKIQKTEEKRCTVNHVAEIEKRKSESPKTEVRRYSTDAIEVYRSVTEWSDLRCTIFTPLLELH